MPLTDEQKQALGLLKSADPKEFADALKDDAQPLFQEVHNRGFKGAEERWKTRATDAEKKAKELEDRAATAERERDEARAAQPDVKKLHDDYGEKLRKQEEKYKAELETERTKAQAAATRRRRADLIAAMTSEGLDPEYAETVADKHVARIRPKEDGSEELLEAGSEIPVQLAQGLTPYKALAAEVKKAAHPKWILSGADHGGGAGAAAAGAGGGYDPVAAGKEAAKQQKADAASQSLAFK